MNYACCAKTMKYKIMLMNFAYLTTIFSEIVSLLLSALYVRRFKQSGEVSNGSLPFPF